MEAQTQAGGPSQSVGFNPFSLRLGAEQAMGVSTLLEVLHPSMQAGCSGGSLSRAEAAHALSQIRLAMEALLEPRRKLRDKLHAAQQQQTA